MNLNNNPTMDQFRELFRRCDDRAGRHLAWVDHTGEVRIEPVPDGDVRLHSEPHGLEDVAPRVRIGYDYVSAGAADNKGWVEDVFYALTREWVKAQSRNAILAVKDW